MIEEKKEHTFEEFESKASDFEFVSSESISFENVKVEMALYMNLLHLAWKHNLCLLLILH